MIIYTEVGPIFALFAFLSIGIGALVAFIRAIVSYMNAPTAAQIKKEKELIRQANAYMYYHTYFFTDVAEPGSDEARKLWSDCNATIREKIKNGDISQEEIGRCLDWIHSPDWPYEYKEAVKKIIEDEMMEDESL